jgi:hypothetical protein
MNAASRRHPFWIVAMIAFGLAVALSLAAATTAAAQEQPGRSSMELRLEQLIRLLASAEDCGPAEAAIDSGMEILYGGLRPLRSKDALEETTAADAAISAAERRFAGALERYAARGGCPEQRGRALDLKLFIEQMNEVAAAVGEVTAECGVQDTLERPPCDGLRPLIDEATGEELPAAGGAATGRTLLRPSFSVKLRSPFVPPWFGRWQHDIRVAGPLSRGQCAVVFKESRGLMLRLHLDRIIIVTDPWVSVFSQPRGTKVPIWRLEWVPAEYGKTWSFCNVDGRSVITKVTQRIKQDHAVNFFWRFYPKDP